MTTPLPRLLASRPYRTICVASLVAWTLICASLLLFFFLQGEWIRRQVTEAEARVLYQKDLSYRHWAASVGGVYVDVGKVDANPYLKVPDKEAVTQAGKPLTLVNPAYMTRLVQVDSANLYGHNTRLKSLNPINPLNTADEWETRALKRLAAGENEVTEFLTEEGRPVFRFLGVFRVEASCLSCHGHQGYHVGDVRGGLSIRFEGDHTWSGTFTRASHASLWGLGLLWLGISGILVWALGLYARRDHRSRMIERNLLEERASAVAKSQENEQRLGRVLNASHMAYCRINSEGRYVDANESMLRIHGLKDKDALLGKPAIEFLAAESHALAQGALRRLSEGQAVFLDEMQHCRADGSKGWHVSSALPLFEGGRYVGADVFILDTSDVMQLRREIVTLLEQMNDGFALHEYLPAGEGGPADYRFLMVNKGFELLTGKTREQVIGHTARELFAGLDEDLIQRYGQVVQTGEPVCLEYNYKAIGKSYLVRVFRPDPGRFACLFSDITDIQKTRASLEADELLLAAIYEQAPLMLVLVDSERRVRRANRAIADYLGREEAELNGILAGNVIGCLHALEHPGACGAGPGCERCALRHSLADALEKGLATPLAEGRYKVLRGRTEVEVTLLFSTKALVIAGEKLALLCIQDVTEARRLQAQMLRMQRLDNLGSLASGVAHDLNNILVPIMMGCDLLAPLVRDADGVTTLQLMKTSTQRGASLVKQLLLFGRGGDMNRRETPSAAIVQEVAQMIRETFPKDIEFVLELPEEVWTLNCDPTQLHQVLLNLCVNARDAMPTGGRLLLSVANCELSVQEAATMPGAHPGPHVLFRVKDNGQGIPPALLEQIFDPFFTTKAPGKGTGLGLSTVLGILRSHDGVVAVDSVPGRGAEFRVYVPAGLQGRKGGEQAQVIEDYSGNGELILIVDDEAAIRKMLRVGLHNANYRVIEASDGAMALNLYADQRESVSAIITDIMMPYMDGRAAIECVRMINPALPVVAISGVGQGGGAKKPEFGAGVVFVPKPFELVDLLKALRQCLRGTPGRPGPSG